MERILNEERIQRQTLETSRVPAGTLICDKSMGSQMYLRSCGRGDILSIMYRTIIHRFMKHVHYLVSYQILCLVLSCLSVLREMVEMFSLFLPVRFSFSEYSTPQIGYPSSPF
jgi:hypothetical protein